MNGILGSFPTNNKKIEMQVMKKAQQNNVHVSAIWEDYMEDFNPILEKFSKEHGQY